MKKQKKVVFIYKINKLTSPYANSSAVEIFWAIEAAGITTRKLEALPFWLPGDCCLWLNWWAELLLKIKIKKNKCKKILKSSYLLKLNI